MRLFIGIELPDDVKRAAASVADDMRGEIAREASRAVLRWVPPENLHITIWFIGEVDDDRASAIRAVMATPFAVPAFMLRIGGAGTFPPPSGDPRAVWLGLVEGRESLLPIHAEVTERLGTLGFAPEKRPYSPHLTIARVKDIRHREAPAVRGATSRAPREIAACAIGAVTLFRSRTSPKGSQYEAVLRVPLG
jgi:2'-5' RNA ligase